MKFVTSKSMFMFMCMAPVVLFVVLVSIVPTIFALIDSLKQLSLTSFGDRGQFIGLDNYRNLLQDPKFLKAIWHTLLIVLIVVPIEFVIGLVIALALNRDFKGQRLVITIIMIPTVIAPVVVGLIWLLMLFPNFGVMTQFLNKFGFLTQYGAFSDATTAFVTIMLIDIWEWTPFMMLILLAGLNSMPPSPLEAAELDGASKWQILLHVQLPLLRPLIAIAILLRTIDATKIFDTVYVLTGGGPGDSTEVISTFAFRTNFLNWNLGYGAAICLIIVFVSVVVAAGVFKVSQASQQGIAK